MKKLIIILAILAFAMCFTTIVQAEELEPNNREEHFECEESIDFTSPFPKESWRKYKITISDVEIFDEVYDEETELYKETKIPGYIYFEGTSAEKEVVVNSGESKSFVYKFSDEDDCLYCYAEGKETYSPTKYSFTMRVQDVTPVKLKFNKKSKTLIRQNPKKNHFTLSVTTQGVESKYELKWKSSNNKVASIEDVYKSRTKRRIIANKKGKCTITCSYYGHKVSCKIEVKEDKYMHIKVLSKSFNTRGSYFKVKFKNTSYRTITISGLGKDHRSLAQSHDYKILDRSVTIKTTRIKPWKSKVIKFKTFGALLSADPDRYDLFFLVGFKKPNVLIKLRDYDIYTPIKGKYRRVL